MATREKLIALVDRLDEAQLEAYCQHLLELKGQRRNDDASQARSTEPPAPG